MDIGTITHGPAIKWHEVQIIGGFWDGQTRHLMDITKPITLERRLSGWSEGPDRKPQWERIQYVPRKVDGKVAYLSPEALKDHKQHQRRQKRLATA